MIRAALVFLILAIVAGLLGFTGIAGLLGQIAMVLFYAFILVFLGLSIATYFGRRNRDLPPPP